MRFIILMLVLSVAPATSCAPIALHCCIVGKMEDGDLVYSRTISEVNAIVADVNRIYEQVAMSFYVASVCMTNSSYFSSVSPNDTGTPSKARHGLLAERS